MPNKPKKEKVRNIFCYWNTFWLIKWVMRWYDVINISVEREYVVGKWGCNVWRRVVFGFKNYCNV